MGVIDIPASDGIAGKLIRSNVSREASVHFSVVGGRPRHADDLVHELLRCRNITFTMLMLVGYLGIAALFAVAFWFDPDGLAVSNEEELPPWAICFFFSVQTLSTIGYGSISPQTMWVDIFVVLESFVGLAILGVGTGLTFARVSTPSARVVFSSRACVRSRDGVRTLEFRLANERERCCIFAATVHTYAIVAKDEMFVQVPLSLTRGFAPVFTDTWTLSHQIDENSPLHGIGEDNVSSTLRCLIVLFSGTDEVYSQSVYVRHAYHAADLVFGHRFVDILEHRDGHSLLHLKRLHDVCPDTAAVVAQWWPTGVDLSMRHQHERLRSDNSPVGRVGESRFGV